MPIGGGREACLPCGNDPNLSCCEKVGGGAGECCNSAECETCIDSDCKPCGGEPNKACCDGTCYDTATQKCCPDLSPRYLCPKNKTCCEGACCDPCECKTCIEGECKVCGGDPNQKCCNGTCVPKCKLVDGEDCTKEDETCAPWCAIDGTNCSWVSNRKMYYGEEDEKICSPRGCPGDCFDWKKNCYTVHPCKPAEWPIPFTSCKDGGYGFYVCQVSGDLWGCYLCVVNKNITIDVHEVQNDICSE